MSQPRVLTFDIESSPHLSWHFDSWKVNISPIQNVLPSRTISVAAKWRDSKTVLYVDERDHTTEDLLRVVREWLDQADVVVGYNSDGYDLPRLNWGFDLWGIPRPSPSVSVDLYKIVKKEYKNAPLSKSLGYITSQLHLTGKLAHEGYFPLWLKMNGDDSKAAQKAWSVFRRYNKRDVITTEELFDRVEHLVTTIPSAGLWTPTEDADLPPCPNPLCADPHVTRQGYRRTKTRRYPQFQCKGCGRWFSLNRSESGVAAS